MISFNEPINVWWNQLIRTPVTANFSLNLRMLNGLYSVFSVDKYILLYFQYPDTSVWLSERDMEEQMAPGVEPGILGFEPLRLIQQLKEGETLTQQILAQTV